MNKVIGIYTEHAYAAGAVIKGTLQDAPKTVKKIIKEADALAQRANESFYHNRYVIAFDDPNGFRLFLGVNDGMWKLASGIVLTRNSKYICLDRI